jgi:hypothetical protein
MRLSKQKIKFFDLKADERVIFYDEDFQVEAIIRFDEDKKVLYGEFNSDFVYVSKDVEEARRDGFLNGQCFGEWTMRNAMIRSMKEHGISYELIIEITQSSEEELRRIFGSHY